MTKLIPEARALTESALLEIYSALHSAVTPEEFLGSVDAIIANADNHLPLPVNLGMPDMLDVIGDKAVDVNNAPRVHDYLGEMDRANACDPRLWTYLAFATYRGYMEKRWPFQDMNKWKERVKTRWLLHNGSITRGRLVRHGIARLWWVSHLTYEPAASDGIAKANPYAYTREVFKREDRLNAIFDREVGAFPNVITAVLKHTSSLGDTATDNYVRKIMQYLTLINGYRDMGMLDLPALNGLVETASSRAS